MEMSEAARSSRSVGDELSWNVKATCMSSIFFSPVYAVTPQK